MPVGDGEFVLQTAVNAAAKAVTPMAEPAIWQRQRRFVYSSESADSNPMGGSIVGMTYANGRRGMLAGHGCYKRGEKTPASVHPCRSMRWR
jgi:hypothetical protein